MRSHPPVVVLEFNELCPSLLDRFMGDGHLPGFRRLYNQSHVLTTAAAETGPNLDPWIQWITVHAGVNHDQHGIDVLGDGHKYDKPRVWDLLSQERLKVWICGSMNINYDSPINGHVLPDPWTNTPPPFPHGYFDSYYKFVRGNVLEHTNGRVPLSKLDQARFVAFMAKHGLSLTTVAAIVKQLASERIKRDHWRRAVLLDRLQCDLFCDIYRKHQPDFSTLFLNSTAHMQHSYWRNMEPELFKVKPAGDDQRELGGAVLYGYQQMDGLVTHLMRFLGPNCAIVLCSALSQQPCLIYEDAGGKTAYRPHHLREFLNFAGVEGAQEIRPVMAHQFHVQFASETDAERARQQLAKLRIDDGSRLMSAKREGAGLFCGCAILRAVTQDAMVEIDGTSGATDFSELFYQCVGLKSGMHHPDGVLWIRHTDATHLVHRPRVPLDSVAPTLLSLFGQPKPPHMSGTSLYPHRRPTALRVTVPAETVEVAS
jgi:hypothetical protein